MENELRADLMACLLSKDEKVILHDDNNNFEIPLCVSAAKLFSPVLKAALESTLVPVNDISVTEVDSNDICSFELQTEKCNNLLRPSTVNRINVAGFEKSTVESLVKLLHGDGDGLQFDWENTVKMLKICHFYNVEKLFILFIEKGESMINSGNFYEVIGLIHMYDIDRWLKRCAEILNPKWSFEIDEDVWQNLMEKYPRTMGSLLFNYLKKSRKTVFPSTTGFSFGSTKHTTTTQAHH